MNSINQYKKKIIGRHHRMLSTVIQRDENCELMHTISGKPITTIQRRKPRIHSSVRVSSNLTSQNQTRETQIHENIGKDPP